MKMNVRMLKKLGACNEAIEEFKKQKPKTVIECFDLLIKQKRIDWANWFITRILSRDNKIRYAIYAAAYMADYSARSAALSARVEDYSVIMLKIIRYGIRLFKKQEAAK